MGGFECLLSLTDDTMRIVEIGRLKTMRDLSASVRIYVLYNKPFSKSIPKRLCM